MAVKKSDSILLFDNQAPAKITKMGHITDLTVCDTVTCEPVCKRLSKDYYLDTRTGEVKEYNHIENRSECFESLRKSMQHIRALINTNVTNSSYVRWITLTYGENMTDHVRLYHDYEKFWKRFLYYCKKNGFEKPEYISVVEPQGRGAWHIHGLFLWTSKAPYIPNKVLADLWGHGFVNIKEPKNCDNLGAYFTAYLTDMTTEEIGTISDEEKIHAYVAASMIATVEPMEKQDKKILKGARLALYPPGINIVRHSRGIKYPEVIRTSYGKAVQYLSGATETYCQSFDILDNDGETINRLLKASYNFKRKKAPGTKANNPCYQKGDENEQN